MGKFHAKDHAEAQSMADKAVAYAQRAVEADAQNFACYKWMGIIISWSSEFLGTKRKIERSYDIRDCFVVSCRCEKYAGDKVFECLLAILVRGIVVTL